MGTNVSKILKSKRKELKLSVKDVIAKLEKRGVTVSDKTLYSWESGHRQPDADTFIILCDIYKITSFTQIEIPEKEPLKDSKLNTILHNYDKLNDRGKTALMEQSEVMASMPQYIDDDIKSNSLSADTVEREEVG